jgi:hypothetical protein
MNMTVYKHVRICTSPYCTVLLFLLTKQKEEHFFLPHELQMLLSFWGIPLILLS